MMMPPRLLPALALLALLVPGAAAQDADGILSRLSEDSRAFVEPGPAAEAREGSMNQTYDGSGERAGALDRESGGGDVVDASSPADWTEAARLRQALLEAKSTPDMNWQSGLVIRPVPVPRVRSLRPERKDVPRRSGTQQGLEGAALIMTAFLLLPAATQLGARAVGTVAGLAGVETRPALEWPDGAPNDERSLC